MCAVPTRVTRALGRAYCLGVAALTAMPWFHTIPAAAQSSLTSPGQAYPSKPIRLIVPQSAGGSTDLIARAVAQRLGDALTQPIVVDNRPGAGSLNGTDMVIVPYKGGAPGIVALLGGQVQLYFATISTALPHVKTGKLHALAVTAAKRSVAAPEFPTIAEAGVPGYHHASWVGMLAPAKTPRAIIAKLNAESVKILNAQEMKTLLLRDGLEPVGDTPEQFSAIIRKEIAQWINLVKVAGIKAE